MLPPPPPATQTPNAGSRPAEKDELSFGAEGTAEEMRLLNSTGEHGLTTAQAKAQLDKWGYNALPEKKINPFLLFLSYLCVRARAAAPRGAEI